MLFGRRLSKVVRELDNCSFTIISLLFHYHQVITVFLNLSFRLILVKLFKILIHLHHILKPPRTFHYAHMMVLSNVYITHRIISYSFLHTVIRNKSNEQICKLFICFTLKLSDMLYFTYK